MISDKRQARQTIYKEAYEASLYQRNEKKNADQQVQTNRRPETIVSHVIVNQNSSYISLLRHWTGKLLKFRPTLKTREKG